MTVIPAILSAVLWGVAAGWWMPRGPLTITQALVSVVVSAAIGWVAIRWAAVGSAAVVRPAGRFGRSRWLLLAVPLAFWVALELVRARISGPSTDAPHASVFGVVVLVAGRGLQAVLTVLPMVLASAYGRGVTGRLRQFLLAVPTAALVLVTAMVAVPARTASIPGGVAELTHVGRLGVMIRGERTDAPVLLFVPGAPGGSELGAVREHFGVLESRFVMATLDRRGGGSSYPALDPTSRVTLDQSVRDTLAVTDYLRQRFHKQRIYLLAHSGGSIISVLAVQRHPEKYAAYIGTGQAVDLPASDRIFYDDILAWARSTHHDDVVKTLTGQGPPPYPDVWGYEPFQLYENKAYNQGDPDFALGVREFTLLQKAHTLNAILDTWSVLYPRMQQVDLRRDVTSLAVPAWFLQGSAEMRGLSALFDEWYPSLRAPAKHLVVVPGAGHRVMFDHPDRLAAVLTEVLADAPAS